MLPILLAGLLQAIPANYVDQDFQNWEFYERPSGIVARQEKSTLVVTNTTTSDLSVRVRSPFFNTTRKYLEPSYITPLITRVQIGGVVVDGSIGLEDDNVYSAGVPFWEGGDVYSDKFASPSFGKARMWMLFLVKKKAAIWFRNPTVEQTYGPSAAILRGNDGKTRVIWRYSPWTFDPSRWKWLLWRPTLGKCLSVSGFEGWGLMQSPSVVFLIQGSIEFLPGLAPRGGWWQCIELRGFLGWNSIGLPFRN